MKKKLSIIILLVLFITLTILVSFDYLETFDTFIYNALISLKSDSMTNIFKFITFFGSTLFIVLATVGLFLYFIIKKDKVKALLIGSMVIVSTIINNLIKIIVRRERPAVLHLVVEESFSFPSGHMMASVTLYGLLFYLVLKSNLKKGLKIFLGTILIILPILIGLSRIYLGVHFASDILGALLMSSLLILISTNIIDKYHLL